MGLRESFRRVLLQEYLSLESPSKHVVRLYEGRVWYLLFPIQGNWSKVGFSLSDPGEQENKSDGLRAEQ